MQREALPRRRSQCGAPASGDPPDGDGDAGTGQKRQRKLDPAGGQWSVVSGQLSVAKAVGRRRWLVLLIQLTCSSEKLAHGWGLALSLRQKKQRKPRRDVTPGVVMGLVAKLGLSSGQFSDHSTKISHIVDRARWSICARSCGRGPARALRECGPGILSLDGCCTLVYGCLKNVAGVPKSAKNRSETAWLQKGNRTSYVFLESADRISHVACLALEQGDGTRRPKVPRRFTPVVHYPNASTQVCAQQIAGRSAHRLLEGRNRWTLRPLLLLVDIVPDSETMYTRVRTSTRLFRAPGDHPPRAAATMARDIRPLSPNDIPELSELPGHGVPRYARGRFCRAPRFCAGSTWSMPGRFPVLPSPPRQGAHQAVHTSNESITMSVPINHSATLHATNPEKSSGILGCAVLISSVRASPVRPVGWQRCISSTGSARQHSARSESA